MTCASASSKVRLEEGPWAERPHAFGPATVLATDWASSQLRKRGAVGRLRSGLVNGERRQALSAMGDARLSQEGGLAASAP